jgi:hypothetical protein
LSGQADIYQELGLTVLGPLIARFLIWLARKVREEPHSQLCFLSREGFLLLRCYEHFRGLPAVQQEFGALPGGIYLLSSRTALMAAARKSEGYQVESLLKNHAFEGELSELFRVRFGCSSDTLKMVAAREGCGKVSLPRDLVRVVGIAMRYREALDHDATLCREAYLRYLEGMNFFSKLPVGIVDIGFSATQQQYLFLMTEQPMIGYYFLTTLNVRNKQSAQNRVTACFAENVDPYCAPAIFRHNLLLEGMLVAPHGQLLGFETAATGSVEPVFNADRVPAEHWENILQIGGGALRYLDLLSAANPGCLSSLQFNDDLLQESLVDLVKAQTPIDISHLRLTVEDDFCGNGMIDVIAQSRLVSSAWDNRQRSDCTGASPAKRMA